MPVPGLCYTSVTMKVGRDRIVALGFGKYVRADKIVALVPIEEDRGSGRRTLVYVEGLDEPLVAGRTEMTILRDMVGAESGALELLKELQLQIGQVRPLLKSSIRSEAGLDLDRLNRRISDLTGES
jgi:predicted transposase YdaD